MRGLVLNFLGLVLKIEALRLSAGGFAKGTLDTLGGACEGTKRRLLSATEPVSCLIARYMSLYQTYDGVLDPSRVESDIMLY